MKSLYSVVLVLLVASANGQNPDALSAPPESVGLFSQPRKIQFDSKRDYSIREENKPFYSFNDKVVDTTLADLVLNTKPNVLLQPNLVLRKCTAKLEKDTLIVTIADLYHDYYAVSIKLFKGRYQMSFVYVSDVQEENRFEPVATLLSIDNSKYRSGDVVRGYIEYAGVCSGACGGMEVMCKGTFKVRIP